MLVELAIILAISGVVLLVVGILIAKQYSLRAKLLTAFLVITLMSLGVLAVIDNNLLKESLTQSAYKSLKASATQAAYKIDQFNNATIDSISTISQLPVLVAFLQDKANNTNLWSTTIELLNVLQSGNSFADSHAILSNKGINLIDTNEDNVGKNESKNQYFQRVIKTGEYYQSPAIFSDQRKASIYFSSAIKDFSGNVIGVLRAKYDADILNNLLKSSRGSAGLGSFAVLLDENMMRLVHGRRSDLQYTFAQNLDFEKLNQLRENKQIPGLARFDYVERLHWINEVKQANFESNAFVKSFYGLGTDLFAATVTQLNTAPWRIVFAQPQEIILQRVADQTSIALFLTGIIAGIVILIVLGTTQVLLGPVRRLTETVGSVANGSLDKKAVVEANDEVGSLANAFNSMTDNIKELVSSLKVEIKNHEETADHLRKLSLAIEQSPSSVLITDLEGNIEYVNPEFCRSSGYSESEIIGQNTRIMSSGETQDVQFKGLWNTIKSGQSWQGELYNKKKNGELYWENVIISPIKTEGGETTHYLAIKEDISVRKDYEEKLLYQATYDKLTDLPNRSLAFDRLQQAIAIASRENHQLALLYIDFDNFKNINDTLGHSAGDKFLVLMAERLRSYVRDVDTVARLGGDEYLIVFTGIGDHHEDDDNKAFQNAICEKANDILKEVALPCFIEDKEFSITASIGVAFYPEDGDDPHVLLRNADTAMYRSKRKGRNAIEAYAPEMNDTVVKRVEIEGRLRHALENERFTLMYQPLVDSQTKALVGAETLLRWDDEELGVVPPDIFIPFAEESGLIIDISNWVIDKACHDLKHWREVDGHENIFNAINLSSRQFRDKSLVSYVNNMLVKHDLPGSSIELEITERMLMKDIAEVILMLNQFKEMGINLSIDDFGTGYSSLSYLKRFPFDVLKVDRAFVKDIGIDPDDEALCDAVIAIAHSLGLSVIGEGVETKEQFDFLRERGTEIIQGYYISKPLTNDVFTEQLTSPGWLK